MHLKLGELGSLELVVVVKDLHLLVHSGGRLEWCLVPLSVVATSPA